MTWVSITDARAALPALLDRVESGEEVVITRHGRPAAVVVRPDLLRARRTGPVIEVAEEVHRQLVAAREARQPAPGISTARADELVADVRRGRDGG